MALQDYYDGAVDTFTDSTNTVRLAQGFTANKSYSIASVKLKIFDDGDSPGTFYVSIKATSGGMPTGGDLCSGSIDTTGLTTNSNGEVKEIKFSAPASLQANTVYAIVIYTSSDNTAIGWCQKTGNPYAGGDHFYSTNSGSSWTKNSNLDCWFETYSSDQQKLTILEEMGY
jgi:hypothetical protein